MIEYNTGILAISQSIEQLSRLICNRIYSGRVYFDTAVQCARGALEVDGITVPQKSQLAKIINQCDVPTVLGIDFLPSQTRE